MLLILNGIDQYGFSQAFLVFRNTELRGKLTTGCTKSQNHNLKHNKRNDYHPHNPE